VDPVPDPLPLRKSGSAGNRTRTSGSVARNSDNMIPILPERIKNPLLCYTSFKYRVIEPHLVERR
jgi:hypothetical protein